MLSLSSKERFNWGFFSFWSRLSVRFKAASKCYSQQCRVSCYLFLPEYVTLLMRVSLSWNVLKNIMLMARKASCHVATACLIRLELIWPISSLKISKMSKNAFLAQSFRSQWVKKENHQLYWVFLIFIKEVWCQR